MVATWILTILCVFGVGLSRMVIAEKKIAAYLEDRVYVDTSINSLLKTVMLSRLADANIHYDTLAELARDEEVEFHPATIVYSLYDEESKININTAPSSVLKLIPGLDKNKAVAVMNSKLRPFFAKEELLILDEIALEDYLMMEPYLTVYGAGRVNINTAGDEVLTALGFSASAVETINEFRSGRDEKLGTADDGYFENIGGIVDQLKEYGTVSLQDQQNVTSVSSKNMLGVSSDYYLVRANVVLRGKGRATFDIIFDREDEQIERWSEK